MKFQYLIALMLILVLAVPSIAGDDAVGLSTTKLGSQVDNVVWCGSNRVQNEDDETIILENVKSRLTNIVYLTNTEGEVYATNTHGEKWANITQTLYDKFTDEIGSKKIYIHTVTASAAEPQTIFMFGKNGLSFVAKQCGKKFSLIKHDKDLEKFKLNRLNVDLILALKPTKCNQFDDECEEDENQLHVTKDQGKTWEKILDNVYSASWDKLIHYALVPDERIIAHQRIYYQGKDNDQKLLSFSDDFYKTKQQVDSKILHYYQSDDFLFMLGESGKEDSYSLKVAPSYAQDYQPQEIDLPFKRIKDHSFTILNSMVGSLYLAINHEGHNSQITNIYHSDYSGRKYNLVAMNVVRNEEGNVDFEKINSNEGTFIANIYDQQELERIQEQKKEGQQSTKKGQVKQVSQQLTLSSIRKTKISFNRGSTWHTIKAPVKNFKGEDINCSGECSLHLKGRTDRNGNPIYTSESAAGLIIATGNTGIYLDEREENLNTYLSSDGGHTWEEIREKPHIYEIADRGGIIVIARSDKATNKLHYSWDHGKTWQEITFSDTPMNVLNIVTEQSNMSQRFLVFGKRKGKSSNKMQGYVLSLNFSKLHQRVCTGQWDPLDEESDFEFFIPKNYNEQKCVFGSRVKYIRRKSDAQCFNPQEFDQINDIEPCECTEEDFECSFGYYRDDDNSCVPMSKRFGREKQELEAKPPTPCNGFYTIPSGYQRIQGNYCQGGVDLGPKRLECPEEEDPNKYVPLDQESYVDLDDQIEQHEKTKADRLDKLEEKQQQYELMVKEDQEQNNNNIINNNENSSSNIYIYGIIIILVILAFKFKEEIIDAMMEITSLAKKFADKSQSSQYSSSGARYDSNFENQGLVSHIDDEEDQL